MGKGDHPRNWAYQLPRTEYAKRVDAIDWSQDSYVDPGVLSCPGCGALPAKKDSHGRCDDCGAITERLRRREKPSFRSDGRRRDERGDVCEAPETIDGVPV